MIKYDFKNKVAPFSNYVDIPMGIPKFNFTYCFRKGNRPTILLWLGHFTKEKNEEIYIKLKSHQTELESIFPDLEWYDNPENKSKQIMVVRKKEYNFSVEEEGEVMEWLSKTMQKFEKAFYPLIQNL